MKRRWGTSGWPNVARKGAGPVWGYQASLFGAMGQIGMFAPSIAAMKRQRPDTLEWNRGLSMAPRHQPEEEDMQLHWSRQEGASCSLAPGEYCEAKLGSTWLDFEE
ncbi:hypothetical protein NDU88_002679 [Pleurodeles waltl]|uniref:Uncharacterized protein n=1 Tax=Pleurodeles waltl TaxID=8319 RepID=A0AAV7PCD6_PLEWA|nr:hypothetical protein NDU88_002679 [Pleurodeles waltl]